MDDPSKTIYGEINANAPEELRAFSFLIGKWEGQGRTKIEDGKVAEFPMRWIGRYILDGMAIADEGHGPGPDGSAYMGISFRQYDALRRTWIIEFLNVNGSFIRRQVNASTGAVTVSGQDVLITCGSPGMEIREHYRVPDRDHFNYRLDLSTDGGKSWNEGQVEMDFRRVE